MADKLIPESYTDVLNSLIWWGRAGLIANTGVIKSYHPAVADNITNVAVDMPASVYRTGEIKKPYQNNHIFIDDLPNAFYSGSNVRDFNVNDMPTGSDTSLAHGAPVNGPAYKEAALKAKSAAEYKKNTQKLAIKTHVDRVTEEFDVKKYYAAKTTTADITPKRISDEFTDARPFYEIQPIVKEFKDGDTKTPLDTRRPIPKRYELLPTKVPCAMPGVLNCFMEVYDNIDIAQPGLNYTAPTVQSTILPDSLKDIFKDPIESATAPSNPVLGDRWWDTDDNKLYVYNGTIWKLLGTDKATVYTLKGEINY